MKKIISNSIRILLFTFFGVPQLMAQVTEHIHGLTILIDFPDNAGFTARENFEPLLNQETGYTGNGWNGSVRQYWRDVSNGKFDYTSEVIGWLEAPHNRSHYETSNYSGLDMLVADVIPQIENMSFSGLSLHSGTNEIRSVNVVIEGYWGPALRPVAFGLATPVRIINDGSEAFIKGVAASVTQISSLSYMDMSQLPHEIGHNAFRWPEYYQQQSRIGNIGPFGLMGYGGSVREDNPTPPNPGLRLQKGWISNVVNLNISSTQTFTANANDLDQIFKYTNPNNPREYFLVEPYLKSGRYQGLYDEGLAIWYVDEEGGINLPVQSNVPRVKIMEADGLEEISNGHSYGDPQDLFDASDKDSFSDFTVPNAKWKDGTNSGLNITNISAVGSQMTFTVEVKDYTLNITGGPNGTISPSGIIHVNHGSSQALSFTPELGYSVTKTTVNGVSYNGSLNGYFFNNITEDKTIEVEFTRKTTGGYLPSPWQEINFGNNVEGDVYYENGKFSVESYGWDIWGNSDNFFYVYQPLDGDGEIIAKVSDQDVTSEWTKAGVMIREELNAGSEHAFMSITPYNGPAFQYRSVANQGSENSNEWELRPEWVKLVRDGNTFTGYYSFDGQTWYEQSSATINMDTEVYVGLASTASTDLVKKGVLFENVDINTGNSGSNLLTQFNVPRTNALPSKFGQYSEVHTLGTGGPNLSNVFNSIFNWNLSGNGLYQFSLETNNGNPRWYTGLETYASHNLNQSSPSITFSNTGFAGLDGTYYVNLDGNNLVLVETSGAYALYFSNSSTPPNARVAAGFLSESSDVQLSASPSPFNSFTTLNVSTLTDATEVLVYDMSGKLKETISLSGNMDGMVNLGQEYESGVYIIQILGASDVKSIKVIKQ